MLIKLSIPILSLLVLLMSGSKSDFELSRISDEQTEILGVVRFNDGYLFRAKREDQQHSGLYFCDSELNLFEWDSLQIIDVPEYLKSADIIPSHYCRQSGELYFSASDGRDYIRNGGRVVVFSGRIENASLVQVNRVLSSEEFFFGHATLSEDGLDMYVLSTVTGNPDLFHYNRADHNSKWSEVRALSELNTTGAELFPRLINDSTLTFSSNGHTESQGTQIYLSTLTKNGKWSQPNELIVLSSPKDEMELQLLSDSTGFFCSNREGEYGLFKFEY